MFNSHCGEGINQTFYRRARSGAEISAPIERKEPADFCGPAFHALELMVPNAPCTGLIPSGRALILSILSILSKKQRQDGQDSPDETIRTPQASPFTLFNHLSQARRPKVRGEA